MHAEAQGSRVDPVGSKRKRVAFVRSTNRCRFGEKRSDCLVCLRGPFYLGHVSAVELEVTGLRESLSDVACESDRHKCVAAPPDE